MTGRTRNAAARLLAALVTVIAGCGTPPTPPTTADTGAREAARAFFAAVVARDWPAAHALLHTGGPAPADFARQGEAYRKRLGFDPTAAHVRACQEHGDEATARVELTGPGPGRHEYKDAVVLRRGPDGWRVVAPAGFARR